MASFEGRDKAVKLVHIVPHLGRHSHSCSCCADVLMKLVQQRGFEMFVHPIAPVLNETRHVVAPFNHKLQQQVISLQVSRCRHLVLATPKIFHHLVHDL